MFKHTATHDGVTFTRDSQRRVYTHCIVRIHNIAEERVSTESFAREYWRSGLKYGQECAAGLHPPIRLLERSALHPSYGMDDDAKWTEYLVKAEAENAARIADAVAWLATGEDGLVAERLAQFDERVKSVASSNGVDYYSGGDEWCGRPDLAEKALDKWRKKGIKAVAVPAVVVESKSRTKVQV